MSFRRTAFALSCSTCTKVARDLACVSALVSVGLVVGAAGNGWAGESYGGDRRPVQDLREILLEAIDSPDGQARAVLTSGVADAITARFRAISPLFVDVTTLTRYAQPGCRRLRLSLWQEGVVLPGAVDANEPKSRSVSFDLNYCRDGLPPVSLAR